jgi:hypothetical protein
LNYDPFLGLSASSLSILLLSGRGEAESSEMEVFSEVAALDEDESLQSPDSQSFHIPHDHFLEVLLSQALTPYDTAPPPLPFQDISPSAGNTASLYFLLTASYLQKLRCAFISLSLSRC